MSTIDQLPQSIDSNVTINPPSKIEISYLVDNGWFITIDDVVVTKTNYDSMLRRNNTTTRFWVDAKAPLRWLIQNDLIVTKAIKELDKAVKKVQNTKST